MSYSARPARRSWVWFLEDTLSTGTLQVVASVLVAVLAAAGSSFLVFANYQAKRRERQPVISDLDQWRRIERAQESCLQHAQGQHRTLNGALAANTARRRTDANRAILAVAESRVQQIDHGGSLAKLREGRQASLAYVDFDRILSRLVTMTTAEEGIPDEAAVPPGSERQKRRLLNQLARGGLANRGVLGVRVGQSSLSRAQKYLTEISYLQPVLLLSAKQETQNSGDIPAESA